MSGFRGTYGQAEGHEFRAAGNGGGNAIREEAMALADLLDKNEIGVLRKAWMERNGANLQAIYEELRAMGYDYHVAMSLISRATFGGINSKKKGKKDERKFTGTPA